MRFLSGLFLLVLVVAAAAPTGAPLSPAFGAEVPGHRQVVITIKGMMCASCGKEVEKSLKKVTGVVGVTVDVPNDRVTVTYEELKTTPRQLAEAIRKAGYEVILPAEGHPAPAAGR